MYKINHIGYLEKNHKSAISSWVKLGYEVKFSYKKDTFQNIICSLFKKKNYPDVEIISILNRKKKSTITNRLNRKIHFDHICYEVKNIENEIKKMERESFKNIYYKYSPIFKKKNRFFLFLK